MKKIVFMVALLVATTVFAQESNRDENGKFQYGPYETNSFFSNWFVELGGGINTPVDNFFSKGVKTESNFGGLALYGNVGKWVDPCFGFRLGWQGLTSGHLGEGQHVDKFVWWPDKENSAFNFIHGDFMVNVSNLFAGYKEKRAIDIVPYVTTGYVYNREGSSFALGGGFQFPIRVSSVVAIVPQVQAIGLNNHVFGGDSKRIMQTSATVGVRINLGKRNWTRKSTSDKAWQSRYDAVVNERDAFSSQLTTAKADNATLQAKNTELAKENEELRNRKPVEKEITFAPATFYFTIGQAYLPATQKVQLDYFIDNVVKNSGKVTFYVAGSTDSATGSDRRNAELRKARAEYVYKYLVDRLGADRVEEAEVNLQDIGATPELSRAVVISNQ